MREGVYEIKKGPRSSRGRGINKKGECDMSSHMVMGTSQKRDTWNKQLEVRSGG